MLTVRDAFTGAKIQIAVAGGDIIRIGFVIPAKAGQFTFARVLVVGDLLRRMIEDVHSAQVLAAVVINNHSAAERVSRSDLMVRPVVGMFTTESEAEDELGKPLDLVITVAGAEDEPAPRPPTLAVAPVRTAVPYPDPVTVRFALANANHRRQLDLTSSMLERSQALLYRWRDRVEQWSHHPSQPIPASWRAAVIAAFDDDLDVARVAAMMSELEDAEDIEPGAKFEAFTYVDRVLAVDLGRHLGQI
ncbi:MAG TPA: hypothetical protein VEF72_08160 [Mycobacterium sp.]|nr:hypothetical protein [Mycobacterium sp.]